MKMSLILFSFLIGATAFAKLNIVTTTTDIKAIVQEVAKDRVSVESIAKGTQDPHFIEAKPSFMTKAHGADLLIAVGLELEVGWLPSIVGGSRNPKINAGEKGYLEVGPLVEPLEVPTGKVSRADGDVHPAGNPHVFLDPMRVGEIGVAVAKRLGELDPPNADFYKKNAESFQAHLKEKLSGWKVRIEKSGIKKIVTYHKTLTYFLSRFGIENPAILEPKPGIPPTSGHILEVIQLMKDQKIALVLVENYFDDTVTKKIKQDLPHVRTVTVPVAVDGGPGIANYEALIETLVKAVEGK